MDKNKMNPWMICTLLLGLAVGYLAGSNTQGETDRYKFYWKADDTGVGVLVRVDLSTPETPVSWHYTGLRSTKGVPKGWATQAAIEDDEKED
ncbi:MAG: hypothetical protein COB10_07575 [Planctomycetota bacterium]|nr:MAG: hypothetical protein COB10_07575 [Planctomycetota bacterium]HIC23403.1 hypothetical protein [Planctomycetota bacterium]